MTQTINDVVRRIKGLQREMAGREGDLVVIAVEIGQLLLQLQSVAKGSWTKHAKDLGYHPRMANRYMALAKGWWTGPRLMESSLLDKLPPDLQKLTWLVKLDEDQLAECVEWLDCRKASRTQVIEAVKRKLHIAEFAKAARPITVDQVLRDCDRFVNRASEAIENAGSDLPDADARRRLLNELRGRFSQLEQLLSDQQGSDELAGEDVSTVLEDDDHCQEGAGELEDVTDALTV
jgi:hypothetical protein